MRIVDIGEDRSHLSELVDAVLQGQEILIAVKGVPVAKLGPIPKKLPIKFGVLKGKIKIAKDFDNPLSEETLAEFGCI